MEKNRNPTVNHVRPLSAREWSNMHQHGCSLREAHSFDAPFITRYLHPSCYHALIGCGCGNEICNWYRRPASHGLCTAWPWLHNLSLTAVIFLSSPTYNTALHVIGFLTTSGNSNLWDG